jgi:hypothetical protein
MNVTAVLNVNTANGPFAGLPSYEQIFKTSFPNATNTQIQAFMVTFIMQTVNSTGYFLPSQFVDKFRDAVSHFGTLLVSSVSGTNSQKILIMNIVLGLLIKMIGIIQKSAISQSNRLGFLTDWQRAYTQTANNIKPFTANDAPFGGGGDGDIRDRADINQKLQAYAENLRSFRSIVEDESKQVQSFINQSTEAANQQANLGTAILQEFSTILQALFR